MKRAGVVRAAAILCYVLFVAASFVFDYQPGREIGSNFASFSFEMLKILPCAFILIGLFQVWVKRETVEKHLGEESGIKGYIWALLLAGTTVGGLYVAFPVAYALYSKGAKLSAVFTYIGASAICRVPMFIYEASFLGIKFSVIRLIVSLPLVVVSSMLLGHYLTGKNYRIVQGK